MEKNNVSMEDIVSLCKRRGFIFSGSEIYGGLAGTFDYGPMGVLLKRNITNAWWKHFVENRDDMYGMDADILMNAKAWEASGHVAGFSDPLSECKKCHHRFRTDHLKDVKICPDCSGELGESRQFNMMFKTQVGAMEDSSATVYLRPETAGGMFVNYKNVMDSIHPKLPFGLAQIGKAFRNEITPRDFIFRLRELEQMEIEYFIDPKTWEEKFEELRKSFKEFMISIGIREAGIHEIEVGDGDRAHYSKRTIDFEFDFPIGQKELAGLAYRGDFDLTAHASLSGAKLDYLDEATGEKFVPHVIEPSIGVERTVLAVLASAYHNEDLGEGDSRVVLKLKPSIAPIKVCVSPLLKNKEQLVGKANEIYKTLKKEFSSVVYDDNGNIGKRYRRQDEIGTPFCVVVDFDTVETDDCVGVRDRDTMQQERVKVSELKSYLAERLKM
jgi:glycyl-tRNA synthetase